VAGIIASGEASTRYLQDILTENYHYVRAAAVRQSPLLSHAASAAQFDLVREFVTGEASRERYFLEVLVRWGVPAADIRAAVPLASTAGFIGLQYRLAHKSLLDSLAGSAVLEEDPEVYAHAEDPYELWRASTASRRKSWRRSGSTSATTCWAGTPACSARYEHYQLGGGSPTKAAL
jgi:hypothetical protein